MTDMDSPAYVAYVTVKKVMDKGSDKNGKHWKDETQDFHIDKAIRHICTYRLIRDVNQDPDGENHLHLALTRLTMALTYKESL